MKLLIALTICILLIIFPADAEETDWGDFKLPADTKVILGKSPDGGETRELQFPGGVTISQNKDAQGNMSSMGADHNKEGAILCARGLLIAARVALALCPIQHEKEARMNNLDIALDRIDNFIVANSLTPITKQQASQQTQAGIKDSTKHFPIEQCTDPFIQSLMNAPQGPHQSSLKAYIDRLLATPRPPVLNPCL